MTNLEEDIHYSHTGYCALQALVISCVPVSCKGNHTHIYKMMSVAPILSFLINFTYMFQQFYLEPGY